MLCNYENPVMIELARNARRDMARNAATEDDYLAAGESTVEDFIPLCNCEKCLAKLED